MRPELGGPTYSKRKGSWGGLVESLRCCAHNDIGSSMVRNGADRIRPLYYSRLDVEHELDDPARVAHPESRGRLSRGPIAYLADVQHAHFAQVVDIAQQDAVHVHVHSGRRGVRHRRRPAAREPLRSSLAMASYRFPEFVAASSSCVTVVPRPRSSP